ncbi:MAG: (Fe-S)-binding protein [Proteobacteria bacterium]|nr:(Fe-S)-binding protein [Pseudomonadota bacterium]
MGASDAAARIAGLADECVKCGLCLPHCPTYALDATETESPRGRIALAAAAVAGTVPASPDLRLHLDHCLGCMACERVCPVPVRYAALLVETRAALAPARPRPHALLGVLSRPRLLRAMAAGARWTLARHWAPPLARAWLPEDSALRAAAGLLPVLPSANPGPASPSARAARGRVALFGGCVQGVFERDAQIAAQRLLQAAGFDAVRIDDRCCGALAAHTGDADRARHLGERVRAAFEGSGAQTLVTATPGCLGTLRAALPGARVEDASGLVAAHADVLSFRPLEARVALHLPCTQVNVARSGDALQRLLARVPQLKVQVLPTQAQCCGAAGSHMLEFPQRAAACRGKLLATLPNPAPDLLLTSNIGCRLHLAAGLRENGSSLAVEHPLTLLAKQLDA